MTSYYKRYVCMLLWVIISFIAVPAMAADIFVQRIRGICEYQRGGAPWMRIAPCMRLKEGDTVRTGWGSDLKVTYDDGSILRISEQTSVVLHVHADRAGRFSGYEFPILGRGHRCHCRASDAHP